MMCIPIGADKLASGLASIGNSGLKVVHGRIPKNQLQRNATTECGAAR
jgi:hypothetical protein